jgi:endo-1,4-beta-xylanase
MAQKVDTHGLSLSGTDEWVDKNTQEPPGTKYKTFHSKTINEEVFYLIYLPPSYETETAKRYPVVYWLHGRGRSPRVGFYFVERLMGAIKNAAAPEMIVVLVNGRSNSMYCDSLDGKIPMESVIIQDLIPHIDATYRTITSREGRAVEGSSMGGFGALHLGFKYPELFGVVTSISGAVFPPEGFRTMEKERAATERKEQENKKKSRPNLFEATFGGNMDYARANSPWTLINQNAEIIRKKTALRMIVGKEDRLLNTNRQLHEHLIELKVTHEYIEVEKGRHSYYEVIDKLNDKEIFDFYAKAFSSNRR